MGVVNVEEEIRGLKVELTRLETRIIAVEKKAIDDKRELQEKMQKVSEQVSEAVSKLEGLETLEDANFMSITHMLGVIARKLNIPKRDLKTGDRRGTGRG